MSPAKDTMEDSSPVHTDSMHQHKSEAQKDAIIAVMGVTGAGKSSFISKLAKGQAKVGHNLESCTSEVETFPITHHNGRGIVLVDTPGFDDTNLTDTQVLTTIASHVAQMYRQKFELNGIIYLHRITDPRLGGSALKNLRMFRKLCGEQFYPRVVLATTMWENLTEAPLSLDTGIAREEQLLDRDDWWGIMQKKGSRTFRHMDTEESALKIINYLLSLDGQDSLAIQREIVEENKTLADTGAGQEVNKDLKEATDRWERERQELRDEFNLALAEKDDAMADTFQTEMDKLAEKVEQSKRDHETLLNTKFKELVTENEKKYEKRLKEERKRNKDEEARYQSQLAAERENRQADREQWATERQHAEQRLQSLLSENRQADQERWRESSRQLVAHMNQQNQMELQQLNSTMVDLREQIASSRPASVTSFTPPLSEAGTFTTTSGYSGSSHVSYHTHTHNDGCIIL